jgi:hypothetical protein
VMKKESKKSIFSCSTSSNSILCISDSNINPLSTNLFFES